MSAMASQITGVSIVCSTVGSCADQRKHQSFASLAFVQGIHRWPVNSPHKRPVTGKCDYGLFFIEIVRVHSVGIFPQNMPQFYFYFQLIWYLFANENLIIILVVNENDRYFSSNTIATIIKLYPMPIYWNYPGTIPHTRDIIDIARGGMSEGQILRLYSDKRTTNTAEMSRRTMLWNNHCNQSAHDTTPHKSYQAMGQLTNTEMSDTHNHSTELPSSTFTWIWHFRELITPQRIERVCFR